MKTVGEILSSRRLELGWSIIEAQKQTKIPQSYLKALEENRFNSIPDATTAKGFIRNYSIYLGLPADSLLAIYRRDFSEKKPDLSPSKLIPGSFIDRISWWTPKTTLFVVVGSVILLVSLYFGGQVYRLTTGPKISIISPQDGQVFSGGVVVEGSTSVDATVKIQGVLINVNEKGYFREEIVLPRGDNILTIVSTDRNKRSQTKKIRVQID